MSTATAFKHHRPFPFCKSQASGPGGAGYDYVDFPVSGSDEGLAAAMQFFWNIENITITPSGSGVLGGLPSSFTTSVLWPSPSLTDLTFYSASGFIVNESLSGGVIVTNRDNAPISRVCTQYGTNLSVTYQNTVRERYLFFIRIVYHAATSRWRLYYNFSIQLTQIALAVIVNPSNTGFSNGTVVNTGTFTLAGLTLSWEARKGPINTFVGSGLTVSETYWTY